MSFSDEKNFLVVGTSFLPLVAHLLAPLGVGCRHLALDDADSLLSLSKLLTVLSLLNNTDAVRVLAALFSEAGDLLCFSFVGPIKFVLNHLESDLDFGRLLRRKFEALLDRWADIHRGSCDFNIETHRHDSLVLVMC